MKARLRNALARLGATFWLVPGAMVLGAILLAAGLLACDRAGLVPPRLIDGHIIYDGGGKGARTLLGAVASSAIGVAGTVFSITIAALSLAAGQMGPRLLRNFTRDRSNQVTLGALLGTFAYALVVLRSVRTEDEGAAFVPHLALSVGILFAFGCIVALVFFVGHMAGRINVDTVVELVSQDAQAAIDRLPALSAAAAPPAPAIDWAAAEPVRDPRRGYLQDLDAAGLARWAAEAGTTLRLLVRPGDYVFPGAPIALCHPARSDAAEAIRARSVLGPERASPFDPEFAVRQLVEVAVRALSPGINDPHTAISVLDRLGSALCDLATRRLPDGRVAHDGTVRLLVPPVDYDGLTDAMFHMIRQNAARSPAVLLRLLEVLAAVAGVEHAGMRRAALVRHAGLVLADAEHTIANDADLADLRERHRRVVLAAANSREGTPPRHGN